MNCTLHKSLALEYFCQTCMDPVCSECIKSNPHSNEYHRISSIEQAVQNRKQSFSLFIENEINPLRLGMRQKLQQLKQIEYQVLQQKLLIQKDVQLDFEGIQHRLRQKSEKKALDYHTQIKYYQGYLNDLDDVVYTFDKTSSDPYSFLVLYQDIHNQLKNLQLKEIKQKIDRFELDDNSNQPQSQNNQLLVTESVKLDVVNFEKLINQLDLPRQFKKTQAKLATLNALNQRNHFINDLISKACVKYQDQQKRLSAEEEIKYKNKLRIFNDTNKQIISLNSCKACAFCGFTFSIDTLNDLCTQNKSVRVEPVKSYSHLVIQQQFKGTKRHYWVDSSIYDRKVPDPNGHSLLKAKQKKEFFNSLKDLQIVKCCFRDYEIDHAKVNSELKTTQINSFIRIFETADKQKKGFLSKITFKYILIKTFNMNSIHCDVLTQILSYKWKISQIQPEIVRNSSSIQKQPVKVEQNQGVNYALLKEFIKNPQFLYKEWQKVEEQIQKSKPIAPVSKDTNKYRPRY